MGWWADNIGGGNSFTESVANTFTPNDGASYVGGNLVHDSGDNKGSAYTPNSKVTGSANDPSNDTPTNSVLPAVSENKDVKGKAPSKVTKAITAGISPVIPIMGKLAGWANGIDPDTQQGEVVDGIQTVSYTHLTLPTICSV